METHQLDLLKEMLKNKTWYKRSFLFLWICHGVVRGELNTTAFEDETTKPFYDESDYFTRSSSITTEQATYDAIVSTTNLPIVSDSELNSTSVLKPPADVFLKHQVLVANTWTDLDTPESNELPGVPGIPGRPGKDYPIYGIPLPKTKFRCRKPGYFVDTDARCQMYHICQDDRMNSFLCPNGTVFDQRHQVCNWWFSVKCPFIPPFLQSNAKLKY
ncbi:uncharacterized protein LOC106458648 [Limulus polyphemus]|uniref:Uncharacterized protein LOC106458648 n=1 Tax=Limulus polyphemus TaxID=6850 RepID=A0ABM1B2S8_LIMPO|nr:uncharacterized protein LOC106458648 [Limulus polyphemus]